MEHKNHFHLAGIGGIGMSALAQLLTHEGKRVSGSDANDSPVMEMLKEKGINVSIAHREQNVPKETEILIYSDAVPEDNPERAHARALGIPELSYFEALGEVSKGRRTVAVSGTHGKTTTTGMLTKILYDNGASPTAIVGSIMKDFKSNFVAGESDIFVVEACEYKRHMAHLRPQVLVILNIELDHTDYFKDLADVQSAFAGVVGNMPEGGTVIANLQDQNTLQAVSNARGAVLNYAQTPIEQAPLSGEFNLMNARAAVTAARAVAPDLTDAQIQKSLATFQGTWRRFEYKGKTRTGALVYDDYAHHPTAVQKTLEMARGQFPGKKITIVFHPHLYSRTKSFLDEFAEELSKADRVLLAPIYPAREPYAPDISSEILAEKIRVKNEHAKALDDFSEIAGALERESKENDVIITMGAGDIYKVAEKIISV